MLAAAARAHRLFISGALRGRADLGLPAQGTLYLLSPDEPGFWAHFTATPEYQDGAADPMDRWSARVIGALAEALGGRAYLPSDGPPYAPFYQWALASGDAFVSPVTLLVHRRMGLWASYRGAIWLPEEPDLAPPAPSPCEGCAEPCASACPSAALTKSGYDVPRCHEFLNQVAGKTCLFSGCGTRAACPVSQSYGRLEEQSAWHMRHFHQ